MGERRCREAFGGWVDGASTELGRFGMGCWREPVVRCWFVERF